MKHSKSHSKTAEPIVDSIERLRREIWLFEQWLLSVSSEQGETAQRIATAYQQCIAIRQEELDQLLSVSARAETTEGAD